MLYKTQLCSFYAKGICARGNKCNWAHGQMDVRPMPKFYKTRMCYTFLSGGYCEASKCTFAHTEEELRGSGKALRLCTKFVLDGYCNKGDKCPMAHNINQLDPSVKFSAAELDKVGNDENNGYKNKSGKHNIQNNSHTISNNTNYNAITYQNNNNNNNINNNNSMKNSHNHASENKDERFPMNNNNSENEKNLKNFKKNRQHYYTQHEKKMGLDFPLEQSQENNEQYYDTKKKKENENIMGGQAYAQGHTNANTNTHTQELRGNEYLKSRKGKMDHNRKNRELFKNEYHKGIEYGKNGEVIKMYENTQKAEYNTPYTTVTDDEINVNMMNNGENRNCKMYNYKNVVNCDIGKCDRKLPYYYNNKPQPLDEFYQRPMNLTEQNMYGISGTNVGNVSNISSMQNMSTVGDLRTICNIEDIGTIENINNINNIDNINTLTIAGNIGNITNSCNINSYNMNTYISNSVGMNENNISIQNNHNHLQYNSALYNNGTFEKKKGIKKMEKNNMGNSAKANSSGYNYHHVKKIGKQATNYHDIEKSYFSNSLKKEIMETIAFDSNTTYAYSKTNLNFYSGTCNEDIYTNYNSGNNNNNSNNTIVESNNNVTVNMTMSNLIDDDTHEIKVNEYENSHLSINVSKNGAARSNNSTMKNVPLNNGIYNVNNMNHVNKEMNREINRENINNEMESKCKHIKTDEEKKKKIKNTMQHIDKKEAEHIQEEQKTTIEEKEQEEEKKKKKENENEMEIEMEIEMNILNEIINYNEDVHMEYTENINYPSKNHYSVQSTKVMSHNNNNNYNNNNISNNNKNNYYIEEKNFSKMNEKMLICNMNNESVGTNEQSMNTYAMKCGYIGLSNQMRQFHFKNAFQKATNVYNEVQQLTPMMDVNTGIPTGMGGITGNKLPMDDNNGNPYNNENTANARLMQNRKHISAKNVQTINNMQNMNSSEVQEIHLKKVNSGSFNGAKPFITKMYEPNVHQIGNVETTNREENRGEVKVKGSGRRARRRGRGGNEKERVEKEQVYLQEAEAETEPQVKHDFRGNMKMEKQKTQRQGHGHGHGYGYGYGKEKGKEKGREKGKIETEVQAESKQYMKNTKNQEYERSGENHNNKKKGEEEKEKEVEGSGENEVVNKEIQKKNQKNGSDYMQYKLDMSVNKIDLLENENIIIEEEQVTYYDCTRNKKNEVSQRMEHVKEKKEEKEEEEEQQQQQQQQNVNVTNETSNKKNKKNLYHTINSSINKLKNSIHNNFINKRMGDKKNVRGLNRRNRNFTNIIDGLSDKHKNHIMHLNNFEHIDEGKIRTSSQANTLMLLENYFNTQKRECFETIMKSSKDILDGNSNMDRNARINKKNNSNLFFNNYNTNNTNNNNNIGNILDLEKYEQGITSSLLYPNIIIDENDISNNMPELISSMDLNENVYTNNFREHVNERNSNIENNQEIAKMRLQCNVDNSDNNNNNNNNNRNANVYKNVNINNMDRGNDELQIQTHAQLQGRINTHIPKEIMTQINEYRRNTIMEGVTEIDNGMKMGIGQEMENEREREREKEREVIGIITDEDEDEAEAKHNTSLCNNAMDYFFTYLEKNDTTNFNKYDYPISYLDTSSLHFNANNNTDFYENINNYIFNKNDTNIIKNSENDLFLEEESFMNIEGKEENEKHKDDNEMSNTFNPFTYKFSGLCECLNKRNEDNKKQQ